MSKLPSKLFNRCKTIPFNQLIPIIETNGDCHFGGVRDKRKGKECVFFTIPNRNNPELPYIKGIEKEELEKLWEILIKKRVLTTNCFKTFFPELYKEGGCCVTAFFGIINYLHPETFTKTRGKISMFIKTQ